jgi:hypothetical protein
MQSLGAKVLTILLLLTALGAVAQAADTGTVSGAVFTTDGQPVAGAVVRIQGDPLPVGRVTETDANGIYRFDYLLPGSYTIEVETPGNTPFRRAVAVATGKDTQVDVLVGVALNESLTVVAVSPIVDVRSSEASLTFTDSRFNVLPVEHTYRGLFQLMPGVADNRSPVGLSAGGSRQDNTYLIDGANITSPGFGALNVQVNQLDIAEVNLTRAGVTAEFGRTAGIVANAVSRSGSSRFSGLARFDWLPEGLVGAYKVPTELAAAGLQPGAFRDSILASQVEPAAGLGGPLIQNLMFFYGSARYGRDTKWGRLNKVNAALPDERRSGPEYYGKLTASASASHQLTFSHRNHPVNVDFNGLTSDYAASAAMTSDRSSRVTTLEWAHFQGPRRSFNVRYLHTRELNEDDPVANLGLLPPFDPTRLSAMGQYMDPAQANLITGGREYFNQQNYRRHEIRGTAGQAFGWGRTSHLLKAGLGFEFAEEELNRVANGWGTIAAISVSGVPALRTRYYTPQPPQYGKGTTYSVFVQDAVTVSNRLSVNAGMLLNRDSFGQHVGGSGGCPPTVTLKGGAAVYESKGDTCTFLRFGFGSEMQPRLGVSYQLRKGRSDKVYGDWGRYYNLDQKSSARSLAPSRIYQTQTVFDLTGAVLSSGPLASTTGKMIDPLIKPVYMDEFVAGYASPLGPRLTLDAFAMWRTMHNFMEDVPSRQAGSAPDSGPFVVTNLPCTSFAACVSANARRTYRSVTIDLRRQLADRWQGDISYSWSRFEGNYDIDYATVGVFNTSSFIQDGPGTDVQDPNRQGPLFEDRPHLVKVFGSYAVTPRLLASGFLRVQSGTPWSARARDWEGGVLNYLEPAGSHRNPTWVNLDLMASYQVVSNGHASVMLETRLLNVFDNQARLSTDAQQYLDLRTIPAAPFFAPYQQPNPLFGLPNGFAPPRRLYLGVRTSF